MMNVHIRKNPQWTILVKRDGEKLEQFDTSTLTPVELGILGSIVADNVHSGNEQMNYSVSCNSFSDEPAVRIVKEYIEKVHNNALTKRKLKTMGVEQ